MSRIGLALARSSAASLIIGWIFAHMSFVIPGKRLRETQSLIAFQHPSPSYSTHILIVPKRNYRSLLELPSDDSDFLRDLLEVVKALVQEFSLEDTGYRLIVNGGDAQDVKHLHFHLVSSDC